MSKNQRGKEYVDPQVQGALWRRLVIHWVAFTAVVAVLVLTLEWMNDPMEDLRAVAGNAWNAYSPLLLVLIFLMPVFVYDSIRLSHRFAGPVFRLRQVIKKLAEGDTSDRLEFRDSDFWKEIAEDMNHVVDRLGEAKGSSTKSASAS